MLNGARAGAAALLTAPIVGIASAIVTPTLSDDAAERYAAISAHRGAVIAGGALGLVALGLLIAGTIWLAIAVAPRAPRLALAGGVLGFAGGLVVVFENSVAAAMTTAVAALDPAQATAALHRVSSAGAIAGLEPLSTLQDVGLALLGLAAVKAGAPRWAGAAIAVGAFAELAGFATGTRAAVIAGFAVLFLGLATTVATVLGRPRVASGAAASDRAASRLAREQAPARPQRA